MNAIVLGGAANVWQDLKALGEWDAVVFAVNDAAARYDGHLDHFVTLHPEKLERWRAVRQELGGNMDFQAWAHKRRHNCGQVTLSGEEWGGSSGLFAVKIALELGATRIVLCGVPMDAQEHFDRPGAWKDCMAYRRHWQRTLPQFSPFTRSMSGWTRELLSPPDDTWLGRKAQGAPNANEDQPTD